VGIIARSVTFLAVVRKNEKGSETFHKDEKMSLTFILSVFTGLRCCASVGGDVLKNTLAAAIALALVALLAIAHAAPAARVPSTWTPDNGNGTYTNPSSTTSSPTPTSSAWATGST
jgi:hypothetical protein